jgi:putative PIN family toxin of toxin-antitoxin system
MAGVYRRETNCGLRIESKESRKAETHEPIGCHQRYDIICDVKVVADTDVIVAAMRSPRGASAELLRMARRREITLLATVSLAIEYASVCHEAEHRLAAGLSEGEVEMFLDAVIAMTEEVKTHFLWRPQLRDPADEMVLEAAVNGKADVLVTFNVRDFGACPARFGVALMKPGDLMLRIRR